MNVLTPELYNRLEPIIFRPLGVETMHSVVDLMLNETKERVLNTKGITLIVDDSVKNYLVLHGFHPSLGARTLKKLIQNTVIAHLSYAIVKDHVAEGTPVTISYFEETGEWGVDWDL